MNNEKRVQTMALQWWQHTVFYQIYPRSFCDSNGDGVGDIPGIISKLDYLKELGVGAIWLSPVYASPNHDNGYDISDYYAINPEYGTLDDMKRLFAEAKRRGLRIIMDLVINHTSDQHPWFLAAQNPSSPYRDYYIWKDAKYDIAGKRVPPNNWMSVFVGSTWQWHAGSGQYYLHLFTAHQPDLNYANPKIIDEVKRIMRFWLDMGAAGFRCDVINVLYKSSFSDGRLGWHHLPGGEHYLSRPEVHRILRELQQEVLEPYGAFTVGESVGGVDIMTAKQFVDGELDTLFTFEHLNVDKWHVPVFDRRYRPERLKRVLAKWQRGLSWNTLFFENHDGSRSIGRFGSLGDHKTHAAAMLAALLLTLRGVPFIYQGQEIGMENYPFTSIKQVDDVLARHMYTFLRGLPLPQHLALRLALRVCRDHSRTPMQWDGTAHAGFTTGTPWLAVHPNYKAVNVKNDLAKSNSIYHFYHTLLRLRAATPALQDGEVEILASPRDVLVYRRMKDGEQYLVVANMSRHGRRLKRSFEGECVWSNYPDSVVPRRALRPYETMVIREK